MSSSTALLKRIIIFTPNVPLLIAFYSGLLGKVRSYIDSDGKWGEILTSKTSIAFHHSKKRKSNEILFKLSFYSDNIAKTRKELLKKGYNPGKIIKSGDLMLCNLNDPDGNVLQYSNRK